jgi:hypothetical protein
MLNDWQRVAREFGDHDMDVVSGCERCCEMVQQTLASYVGDWLPSEPAAKEILRLRKRVEDIEDLAKELSIYASSDMVGENWRMFQSAASRLRAALDAAKEVAK